MSIGIYKITNTINKKVYIGQSIDIENRLKTHIRLLNTNKHYNNHLQSSWNKYTEASFIFDIIEYCSQETLDEKEKYYIALHESSKYHKGYNLTEGGDGVIPNEETRQKQKNSAKTSLKCIAHRQKLLSSESFWENLNTLHIKRKGTRLTDEDKLKMSESHKNNSKVQANITKLVNSPEHKERMAKMNADENHIENLKSNGKKYRAWLNTEDGANKKIEIRKKMSAAARLLTDTQIDEAKKLRLEGVSYRNIAKKFDVAYTTIYFYINNVRSVENGNKKKNLAEDIYKTHLKGNKIVQ